MNTDNVYFQINVSTHPLVFKVITPWHNDRTKLENNSFSNGKETKITHRAYVLVNAYIWALA